jgi:hypothetical protein
VFQSEQFLYGAYPGYGYARTYSYGAYPTFYNAYAGAAYPYAYRAGYAYPGYYGYGYAY